MVAMSVVAHLKSSISHTVQSAALQHTLIHQLPHVQLQPFNPYRPLIETSRAVTLLQGKPEVPKNFLQEGKINNILMWSQLDNKECIFVNKAYNLSMLQIVREPVNIICT
jgi:hypothetical protein